MNFNSKKNLHIFCVLAISIVAVSCVTSGAGSNKSNEVISVSPSSESQFVYHYSTRNSLILSSSIAIPESLSKTLLKGEEIDNLLQEVGNKPEAKIMREFSFAAVKMKSWQEVHKAAQECIAKTTGSFGAFHIHQMLATTMLNTYFLMQKPTPDVQEAVGYYMDVLIKHKNYLDPNLKAAVLPMLIGYWSSDKITQVAQKNFETTLRSNKTTEAWLQDFYKKRGEDLAKQSPEQYAQMNSTQRQSKIEEDVLTKANSFPKRSKPYPDAINNYQEYEDLKIKENPESIAILALLAQGTFNQNKNR